MLAISGCKKKETYTVTFNPNGDTGTMASQTFTEGKSQALTRNTFTYDGYTFTNWNTIRDGSGTTYNDGSSIKATADMTLYAQWTSNSVSPSPSPSPTPTPTPPYIQHEYVDLGLPSGLLWATCKVGASNPEDFGDYFAWGEIATKGTYEWSNYGLCNGGEDQVTKYCNNSSFGDNGFTDNLTTLTASDDAAPANWGAGWRIPTREEISELKSNCTVTWTTQNEVNGYLFSGSNGNSIFIPAAGYRSSDNLYHDGTNGNYWSSSLYTDEPSQVHILEFGSSNCILNFSNRNLGYPVRAVCQSRK